MRSILAIVRRLGFGAMAPMLMALVLMCHFHTAQAAVPSWNQVANVKDAAQRLAKLHRSEGTQGVMKFLEACYKTHMLASEFTQGLEACMAQDYMHSQELAAIYSKVPEADRVRLKAPSPELISGTMAKRFEAVFEQYHIDKADAEKFKKAVDQYAFPIFLKAVFQKAGKADGARKETR